MSSSHSERLQEEHNRGQEEAAAGEKYDPPHGELDKLFVSSEREAEMIAENEAYGEGWEHARSQQP